MTKTERAVAGALRCMKPEAAYGLTADVPVIYVPWARWNHTVDAIASTLEQSAKPRRFYPIDFLAECGLTRTVPFDDLEVSR